MEPEIATSAAPRSAQVPLAVRLHLGRAAVQTIAHRVGADLLHIKGDTVDPTLRPGRPAGSDVDVLVRPAHVVVLDSALRRHGWSVYSTFRGGSPFGHAQTYRHDVWGYLDLHRFFPGIELDAASAFARLWRDRASVTFGGVACAVPGVAAQATILAVNAARAGAYARTEVDQMWRDATPRLRAAIDREVRALDARLAFDAAFGELERHRGARTYRLWKAVSDGGGRAEEWWGRLRASRGIREAFDVLVLAPQVNTEVLSHRLGRTPTRSDVIGEFFRRPLRGARRIGTRHRR
ncbi:hypothetical protein GCM10022200_18460 [Microbacterium awajiense]|uniref:2-nitropropane dioxygenase n=1 Tax=Microbacterium awajiense TaxID=415214 RepID=A0ABP7ALC8_9MICO